MPPSPKCFFCAAGQPPKWAIRQQFDVRETLGIAVENIGIARAKVVLGRQILPFRRVQEIQIGLGKWARAMPLDHLVERSPPAARPECSNWAQSVRGRPSRLRSPRAAPRSP